MRSIDITFLGGGPTGPTVIDHYLKDGRTKNYLLITEEEDPRGAVNKGVKVVNPIVTKLPNITRNQCAKYEETLRLIRAAEARLESIFRRTNAYTGASELAFRYCRDPEELDILNGMPEFCSEVDDGLLSSTKEFIEKCLGSPIDVGLLFAYKERVWNVTEYMRIIMARIPGLMKVAAKRVEFDSQTSEGTFLVIHHVNGSTETVFTRKLIVCKGIGNINFENQIMEKTALSEKSFNFKVLEFSKFIYNRREQMPNLVTSIMIPGYGICVTNEQEQKHSLLYDTNTNLSFANRYDPRRMSDDITPIREKLNKLHPGLPQSCVEQFRCAMTVDSRAYTDDVEKHFQFVISPSVLKNVQYVNLPYFTVIGLAINYLPKNINDLK